MMGRMIDQVRPISGAAALSLLCGGASVLAGPGVPPSYVHDFVTVGAPGNRPALESERYYGSAVAGFPDLGRVGYSFRISRTETTVQQWLPFVNAAWQFAFQLGYSRNDPRFTASHIFTNGVGPNAVFEITPGTNQLAGAMSFRFAAWYCNWRHNGSPTVNLTMETFTTGAYDANLVRQAGAQFWVPNLDEWTKATYYDPNRYGAGQEGYWRHPGMSDTPLVGGPPGAPGAQTSAGSWHQGQGLPPNVGSYPSTHSPWGLLDTSGGVREWTDVPFQGVSGLRYVRGEDLGGGLDLPFDRIDFFFSGRGVDSSGAGFRMASAIPLPGTCIPFAVWCGWTVPRRRRRAMT